MLTPGEHVFSIDFDGEAREYVLYQPSVSGAEPLPAVFLFHGRNVDGRAMTTMSGMNEQAERDKFVAIYPNGRLDPAGGRYWLVHYTPDAVVTGCPELPFVDALLVDVKSRANVDPRRLFAVGFSNGAILCFALARWRSCTFGAIATVAGLADFGHLTLECPVSILHFHGTRDRFIPYHGGRTARKDTPLDFPPVAEMLQPWLEANGCMSLDHVENWVDPCDSTLSVRKESFGPGWSGAEVAFVTIENGGHTWPGRTPPVSYLGKWTTAISASDMIAEFFRRHPISTDSPSK